MSSIQLVNSIVEWERRIEFEEERRKNYRIEPYVNYLAAPQSPKKDQPSLLSQILGRSKKTQPAYSVSKKEPCKSSQPC